MTVDELKKFLAENYAGHEQVMFHVWGPDGGHHFGGHPPANHEYMRAKFGVAMVLCADFCKAHIVHLPNVREEQLMPTISGKIVSVILYREAVYTDETEKRIKAEMKQGKESGAYYTEHGAITWIVYCDDNPGT